MREPDYFPSWQYGLFPIIHQGGREAGALQPTSVQREGPIMLDWQCRGFAVMYKSWERVRWQHRASTAGRWMICDIANTAIQRRSLRLALPAERSTQRTETEI